MNGFSLNLGKAKKPARRENVLDGEREGEREDERRVVAIDGFGPEEEKEKPPLVIPRLANGSFRSGEDEEAIHALLHGDRPSLHSIVLPEEHKVRTDVAQRPEMASLQAYAAVPIDEFGWAALRGMGWQEGRAIGRRRDSAGNRGVQHKERQPRPALLGLGARLAVDAEGQALPSAAGRGKAYQPLKRVRK